MALAKAEVALRVPMRRAYNQAESALYLGVGASKFADEVGRLMPRPRIWGGTKLWDVQELDAAFWNLPREGEDAQVEKPNPWH